MKNIILKSFIVLIAIVCNFFLGNATTIISRDSLYNENIVLDYPAELHVKSSKRPIINSKIYLNHIDAWVFFDSIRPSKVLDSLSNSIFVNNEVFVNGINGRIAIYGCGSVIIPHSNNFKPLTVYKEESLQGDSLQLLIHTYYNNLGNFDNAIKSFKLKRGYMATFATNSDGTGYSRVFIADKEDIIMNSLPPELKSTISFIRVFKYQWVSKKGWCGWNSNDIKKINATCYYDWSAGGNTTLDVEYTPIKQKATWPSWDEIFNKQNVTHVLGYNEPDKSDQANMSLDQMLAEWPNMMKTGLRIGSPAWANPWSGNGGNLFDFIRKCDELNYRVDFIALHCYWGGKSPQNWYNDLKYIHEVTGRPLWITEWNNGANWTTESWPDPSRALTPLNAQKQLNDIKAILQVLDTAHFVERYFIYNWVQDCRAMILADTLTPAGKYYASNPSRIAYNSINDVIPKWNYSSPQLTYQYLNLSDKVRLDWTNPNGDLCNKYYIEKKINNENFTITYTGDGQNNYYLDNINRQIEGTVRYRVNLINVREDTLKSNEVVFYQIGGNDTIKFGKLLVTNFDWSTVLFNNKFTKIPVVISGTPSYKNIYALTQRISNVKNNLVKFHLEPWLYLNNPILTEVDTIGFLALNPGNYDFDGIKAEAKIVSGITRNWTTITFDKPFTNQPVVFCNVVTSANSIPLTVAIRNVTTTSFEVSLKTEEANTDYLLPEVINYLAIETGRGKILNKSFIVGKSAEGNGLKTNPIKIEYDSTFKNPILFASLQTSMDNFASTIRYRIQEKYKYDVYKQREFSGSTIITKEDQFGWMIIDLSETQNTDFRETNYDGNLNFYPNPVSDRLYINIQKPIFLQIIDLSGNILIEGTYQNYIDVSLLKPGFYLLKSKGLKPIKFVKN